MPSKRHDHDREPSGNSGATPDQEGERVISGLAVSPGIAIGTAYVRESGVVHVPEYCIPKDRVEDEKARFAKAVAAAQRQVRRLRTKAKNLPPAAAEELGYLLDAYDHMLEGSRLVRGVERRIDVDRLNAESAVQAEIREIARGFEEVEDAYLAARLDDIREVATRIVRHLSDQPFQPFSDVPDGAIIVTEELTPADTAVMDPARIAGFATALGGAEGHTAIMARALSMPAVVGAAGLIGAVKTGDRLVVDGLSGRVYVNPEPTTIAEMEDRKRERERERRNLDYLRHLGATTRDGTDVVLRANVELPIELGQMREVGADGIGLLRTEFQFMNRGDIPDEDEQYAMLRTMVEGADGGQVTIRTLDIGGEKTHAAMLEQLGESAASALGLRGIRLSLARTDMLRTQIRAILRAGAHGPVRILLPMVTTVSEMRRTREIVKQEARKLKRRRIAICDDIPPVGAMIEVPGAALAADALAQASDFFAIGSNDLTMYTLAIDRSDEQVAALYDPLHPAVLRLLHFTTLAAARAKIPLCICGEMAGDPRYTAILLGLGIRELSMAPANLPRVKGRVREVELAPASRRAKMIMEQMDAGRIAILLDDFNNLC